MPQALALVDQKQYGAATAKYEEMAGTAEEIQNREDRLRWLENINWGIAAAIAHDTNRELVAGFVTLCLTLTPRSRRLTTQVPALRVQ